MKWSIFVAIVLGMSAAQCVGAVKCTNKYGTQTNPGRSCADILQRRCADNSPEGVYWIALESSQKKNLEVTVKRVSSAISYQGAQANCKSDGKELCSSKEICKDGKRPYHGVVAGDHWVPTKDSFNAWLQVGNHPHSPCTRHRDLGSKPSWGVKNSNYKFKGILHCCKNTFYSEKTSVFPVFCDMEAGGWTLVFKGVSGVPGRIAGYWKLPYPSFEFTLDALNKDDSFKHHYKNRIVQNWTAFKPKEARVVIYYDSKEKMVLRFDARNSNNLNWFSQAKLLEAPWEDILKAKKNHFILEGPCWSGKCRDFHINSVYGGCPNDLGWLSVGDSRACKWENRFVENSFLYSNRNTFVNYNKYASVGSGDVFAVYLR